MRRLLAGRAVPSGHLGAATLAPLVDVLTLLLVFLLRAWSADPPVRPGGEPLVLPVTASEDPAPRRLAVDVATSGIYVDGRRVAATRATLDGEGVLVREVYDVLLRRAGEAVVLRVDGAIPYALVRKLLFTLDEAGVRDVALVAESRSGL